MSRTKVLGTKFNRNKILIRTDRVRSKQFWDKYSDLGESDVYAKAGRTLAEARLALIEAANNMNQ